MIFGIPYMKLEKVGGNKMGIGLQCSNCGTRLSLNPTEFWKYGWRYTGVPYCSKCVKTWKERNGKEWNEQYNEELMKDIFYQYLFDKISSKKLDSERHVIYENKESLYEKLTDIVNSIDEIKNNLGDRYSDINESRVDELKETIENNNDLIDEVVENLEDVIYDIEVLQDNIEDLEVS